MSSVSSASNDTGSIRPTNSDIADDVGLEQFNELEVGDIVVVSSDGLQYLEDARIQKILHRYRRKKAAEIAGAVSIIAEVDGSRINTRRRQGWVSMMSADLAEVFEQEGHGPAPGREGLRELPIGEIRFPRGDLFLS